MYLFVSKKQTKNMTCLRRPIQKKYTRKFQNNLKKKAEY